MLTLTAKDIMKTEVLFAYEGWSIKYLGEFLRKHKITGAPVVASDHELVGVVSVTDVFNFENSNRDQKLAKLKDYYQECYALNFHEKDLESWSLTAEESCTVHQIMNNKVISVTPDCNIKHICRTMVDNGIHRVFVTKDKQIEGVISTSDILGTIAETN
jgi:predicted transcriptional regulator